jgi:vancomycin resistance protein YoaR
MKKRSVVVFLIVFLLVLSAVLFISANLVYGKVFPNFRVNGVSISSMTIEKARSVLSEKFSAPESIKLVTKEEKFDLKPEEIDLEYDIDKTVFDAYGYYRSENALTYIKGFFGSLLSPHDLEASFNYNEEKLNSLISAIAVQVEDEPVYPSAHIEYGDVIINPGDKGTRMDRERLVSDIEKVILNAEFNPIPIIINEIDPTLDKDQTDQFRQLAETLSEKTAVFFVEDEQFTFTVNDILKLVDHEGQPKANEVGNFIDTFSQNQNKNPQNSVFEYKEGSVEEFVPSKNGIKIKETELTYELSSAITQLTGSPLDSIEIDVPYEIIPPEITNDEVNDLGINELVGKGSSNFRGSISSRIYNIGVASNRINGTLIKPDGVLSFNSALGDISEYTGYKKAYVIKDGQTVLGDGGGVCQVSTTLFRAALDAGLPIVERRAHSYRVTYYEQGYSPGLDATVYAPTTDLKIKNDTPGHLLIQTVYNPANAKLDFEIYGTDDGRVSTVTKPTITSSTPPPEDLYIDDPTLPQGEIKQIDWKSWGAKVNFDYTVERNGEVIFEKTFYSNFQPWQAKFLRGTAPIN